jgi:single-stranded-DNA-specific exonuclease
MKKWQLEYKPKTLNLKLQNEDIVKILLENRGIKTKKERDNFLNPDLSDVTPQSVNINDQQLKKALIRIQTAIKEKQAIIVFGDYDVDGICASAILWETLNSLGANVMPYIPSRFEEGYGLSEKGIVNLKSQIPNPKLIITVDNGIVANDAVDVANKNGIDVIITDHHVPAEKLPNALAIVHTTALCGAGVAWLLAQQLKTENLKPKIDKTENHLELVVLATIADLVPLTNSNRILVYFGLQKLRQTKRPGLLALINKSGIKKEEIDTYHIGHMLAPRLNAMGRLASAMDSLRLVCTNNIQKAEALAEVLNKTNLERQQITQEALAHAKGKAEKSGIKDLLFIADESYQQGIVGLVAGRMVEEYYRPSIIISKGEKVSRASARSVKGFNIVEFLREASDLLIDVGGHPMAAGFTVETDKLELLKKRLFESIKKLLKKEHLERILRIDLKLKPELINYDIYSEIQKLAPFGMGNTEPTFVTKSLTVSDLRVIGKDSKHLKLKFTIDNSELKINGIWFGVGDKNNLKIGDKVDVVYTMTENNWNGYKNIELKVKDIAKNS